MFDIGWSELLVIGVVALIAIGPKELPSVLRTVGHWTGKIRRMAAEFQGQFQEAIREAEMADLKKEVDSIGDSARNFASSMDAAARIEDPPSAQPVTEPIPAAPPPPLVADTPSGAVPMPPPAEQQALPPPDSAPAAASAAVAAPASPAADLHIPPPEPAPPLSDKDFAAPALPPAKAGEGGA
jgi:sec-independent protein translocase protein TatB